jgi:hypothetical protein
LHWHHCQPQAVLVAGVAPALLPSWPSKNQPVLRWHLQALRSHFTRIALASLPMLPIFLTSGNLISGFVSLVSNSLISLSYQQQQQVSTFLKG